MTASEYKIFNEVYKSISKEKQILVAFLVYSTLNAEKISLKEFDVHEVMTDYVRFLKEENKDSGNERIKKVAENYKNILEDIIARSVSNALLGFQTDKVLNKLDPKSEPKIKRFEEICKEMLFSVKKIAEDEVREVMNEIDNHEKEAKDPKRVALMTSRRELIEDLENTFLKDIKPEDRLFYLHRNEDHIILSHALFWVMSRPLEKTLRQFKTFQLILQYEEEMLEAYLVDSEEFPDLLKFCNVTIESLPMAVSAQMAIQPSHEKDFKKLVAIANVALGYGGDIDEDGMYEILDDMDFRYNKVYCAKIEKMLPMLNKMVIEEMKHF